jgi:ssDNA-binding replication factor A large subunit
MRAKRSFLVFDDTAKIEVTFWDSYAENFNLSKG